MVKHYFLYKLQPKVFKLVLNPPPQCFSQTTLWIFLNFEFLTFNDFLLQNFNYSLYIVPMQKKKRPRVA